MVTAGALEVHMAVPIVIGANIGTSVTNTLVAMTQVNDKNTFRDAIQCWREIHVCDMIFHICGINRYSAQFRISRFKDGNSCPVSDK